ncbi:MAG: immunoglobulin domain-containing protein, partial [Rhodoferax sp.]|nr:immunoglobulin domain-containing protein [Rhodoferax sp.]
MILKTTFKLPINALVAACLTIALTACGGGGGDSGSGDSSGGSIGGDNSSSIDGSGGNGSGGGSGRGSVQVEMPMISTQPSSQSVVSGGTATFTVTATGGGALSYQWKKNGTDIIGAIANTYTTNSTSNADIGAQLVFSVVVTNSAGSATSEEAILTVTAAPVKPAIDKQPLAQLVIAGESAHFSVSTTGTAPFIYQWQKNGTNIPGATSNTYTTPVTSNADIDTVMAFSVVVTNSAGSATSEGARLTVTAAAVAPAITNQPLAQTVHAGQAATFSVTASGTSLSYQWKK